MSDARPGAGIAPPHHTDQRTLQLQLEEGLRFESLVVDLSLIFIHAPARELDRQIEDAQRRICEVLDLDLSALWQWSGDAPESLRLTHLYRPLGGPPIPEEMDAQEYFPWCRAQLMAGKTIAVECLESLPPAASCDRRSWLHYGIQTSLTIPLSTGDSPILGALSFNTMRAKRAWPESVVQRLGLIAQIFANALSRRRTDEMLCENEERMSLAADAADAGLWSLNLATGRYWLTGKTRELFGFAAEEEVTFERFLSLVHPQDQERVRAALQQVLQSLSENQVEYRVLRADGSVRWFASRGRTRCSATGIPEQVMGVSAEITARKHTEQMLEERLRFEQLLANLSAAFVNQPAGQLDRVIDNGLRLLVESLGHDRSTIGEFSADTGYATVTHSYTALGLEPLPKGLEINDRLPWYLQQLRSGKTVFFRRPDELPPEAEKERRHCHVEGIESNLSIPLKAGGTVLGGITFTFLRRRSDWDETILSRLHMLAGVFANAILHQRDQDALRAALVESEKLRRQLERENTYLREQVTLQYHHERVIGKSRALKKVLSEVERVAVTETPVLLLGETGTGKELLAQTIHELSARRDHPMVVVNCASLPATLIESELFGREAGAYTGAASAQIGRFEVADGSTLFLDEIGEFPIELQAKLLRVLQDGRFERLGSPKTVCVNVRVIAATNRDLERSVREGLFRADLYHRLNVFPICLPPLRERREDIPLLVWAFVETFSRRMGKTIKRIPRRIMEQLEQYDWPGNVREVSNVVERAMILSSDDTLSVEIPSIVTGGRTAHVSLQDHERELILRTLEDVGWRIRGPHGAAQLLGLKPTTLESRMAKLGIRRPRRDSDIS